ncbi:NACHT domain-containing protein [Streptomyces litchfieldiae]|uniref:NACHT domain-containing protein n=1 Tax=Streptomyces litchfieldiae TaxID=3075543 RepID=A0ABU2MU67_9ACTN|nr:NACHT domain-containing protein [Streptomyces sp. DSM 44938]MDT0345187.1 NACHT domain-containing protein [Streptomyces sp. DSM 44938]
MDAASIGLRLGSSAVAPLVKRLFRTQPPGAGLVSRPVRLDALVAFGGEKRTLGAEDLGKLAGELVDRAIRAMGPEGSAYSEHRVRVWESLAMNLWTLGDLDMDDVQAVQLGADGLARALEARDRLLLHLPADAEELRRSLLRLACLHIIDFFTKRSTFIARTLVEQTRQNERMITVLDLLVERLPPQSAVDGAFEERYRRYVAGRHGRLTIFGLDLDDEWPLDDAYIHLETTRGTPSGNDQPLLPPQRAEVALRGAKRVLLRGGAGSGKTTLMQWLAVTTAEHRLPEPLLHLLGQVPFVLPLRTLTRAGRELPAPDGFLAAVGCPHTPPPGWAERVLAAGRGLLLVDGVDEIPEESRPAARAWLRELLREFPGNALLVTARPSAVAEDWLAAEDFGELSLSPMSRQDVATFIHRWHRAARADADDVNELLEAVRGRRDLARLATNPLMCAVMCALHRASHGYLPHGRAALYEAALRMLLERRDRQRKVHHGIRLDAPTQTLLLQELAYWLIRNGHSEMDRSDAEALIENALPSMPQAAEQGSAQDIYRHLLERSGLLREPAEGLVDFVHRTFQDYLAARQAIESRDIPLLVRNAHRDQWEDVIRMAVAHARPEERARILKALVKRGDDVKRDRIRLHLLATACLEHAPRLDPDTRHLVTSRAAQLLPPRTSREAHALAGAGRVVLELLPGPEGLADHEAAAVVDTIGFVGDDTGLPLLARFCSPDAGDDLRLSLKNTWHYFDAAAYAKTVLPHLPGDLRLVATTPDQFGVLGAAGRPFNAMSATPHDLIAAGAARTCVGINIDEPCDLADLRHLTALEGLTLMRGAQVRDVSSLAQYGLKSINVQLTAGQSAQGLERLTAVEELIVFTNGVEQPLALLPPYPPVTWLHWSDRVRGLTPLRSWPRLRTLALGGTRPKLGCEDWESVHAAGVTALFLTAPVARTLLACEITLPHVVSLTVWNPDHDFDLAGLAEATPNLERLTLTNPPTVKLRELRRLASLREVFVRSPGDVTGADELNGVTVTTRPRPRYGMGTAS